MSKKTEKQKIKNNNARALADLKSVSLVNVEDKFSTFKISFWKAFWHSTTLTGKKKYIGNQPKTLNYYEQYPFFAKSHEGNNWFVPLPKKINKFDNQVKQSKNDAYSKGDRLHFELNSKLRATKFLSWVLPIGLFIVLLILGLALFQDKVTIFKEFWLYLPSLALALICWIIYIMQFTYIYKGWVINERTRKKENQAEDVNIRIIERKRIDRENSEFYLGYNALKNECAEYLKIDDRLLGHLSTSKQDDLFKKTFERSDGGFLATEIFELNINPRTRKIEKEGRLKASGYAITTFDLNTKQEQEMVRNNNYPSEVVYKSQWGAYRTLMNPGKSAAPLYEKMYSPAERALMKEAILVAVKCHALCSAGSGKGKTAFFSLPTVYVNLLSKARPSIFFNSKGDDLNKIYPLAVVCDYIFFYFVLSETAIVDKWNPLSKVWHNANTIYSLKNGLIQKMDISCMQYTNAYNFSIRLERTSNFHLKKVHDNVNYISPNMKFTIYHYDHTTGELLTTPRQILNEIMFITQDHLLEQEVFGNNSLNVDTLEIEYFIKFLLKNYKLNRSQNLNYEIGKIVHNYLTPYLADTSDYNYWFKIQKAWYTPDMSWYLCGSHAFKSLQEINGNYDKIIQTLNTQYHEWLDRTFDRLLSSGSQGAKADFFNSAGKNVVLSVAKFFPAMLIQTNPDIYAEEYFTFWNICRTCELLEMSHYSDINEHINKMLRKSKTPTAEGPANDPYTLMKIIAFNTDPDAFSGFSTEMSRISDTFGGVDATRNVLTKDIASNNIFNATCYSSMQLETFLLKATFIYSAAAELSNGQTEPATSKMMGLFFKSLFDTYRQISAFNGNISPTTIYLLLDEFSTVHWDRELITYTLADGRALDLFVCIIVQNRKQIIADYDETFLNFIESNSYLQVSLGEDLIENAEKVSKSLLSYNGIDYSEIESVDDFSEKNLKIKNMPYFTPEELMSSGLGQSFGTLNTSMGKKAFSFRNLLIYNSQIMWTITHNEYLKNLEHPSLDFTPVPEERRFDFAHFALNYFNLDNKQVGKSYDEIFEEQWNNIATPTKNLTNNRDMDAVARKNRYEHNSIYLISQSEINALRQQNAANKSKKQTVYNDLVTKPKDENNVSSNNTNTSNTGTSLSAPTIAEPTVKVAKDASQPVKSKISQDDIQIWSIQPIKTDMLSELKQKNGLFEIK